MCPREFEWLLFGQAWSAESSDDAAVKLLRLINELVPNGSALFGRRYTMAALITANDGYIQKAFVHAMVLASMWLGRDRFPVGVHHWPPVNDAP